MLDSLKKLLEDNYDIFEENKNIDIYFIRNGIPEQEIFLRIKDFSFNWIVYICHRNNKREIGVFKNREDVLAIVFILCKKTFENNISNQILKRKIRSIGIENIHQETAKVIKAVLEEKYF